MKAALAVRVLIQFKKGESRLELAVYLLLDRVRELHPGVVSFELKPLVLVHRGIERKAVHYLFFVRVDDVIDEVIRAGEKKSARFQDSETLPPYALYVFDVTVRHRMKDKVEFAVLKRKRLRHIPADRPDLKSLAPCDFDLAFDLLF